MVQSESQNSKPPLRLVSRITCPHCWEQFAPEEILWISEHSDLLGDLLLGPEQLQRFRATRFNVDGDALDAKGFVCRLLACPHCHLPIPRAMLEMRGLFLSIIGAPASGKSYYLATLTWELRKILADQFAVALFDADPAANRTLHEYEELLFLNPEKNQLVALRKTELQGELYDTIAYGHQTVSYLRPFLFSLQPQRNHPNASASENLGRVLALYDNAGEHFLPGQDTSASPVTRHLARSRCLFFLFDPTQDQRFRDLCQNVSSDPQMKQSIRTSRQESILHEAAARVRRYTGLSQHAKHDRPLIVILTKSDAWAHLLSETEKTEPWRLVAAKGLAGLDLEVVEKQSGRARKLLMHVCPEIVAAAEGFSNSVTYIPVSALGRSPEQDERSRLLGIRPRDIRPNWVTVPFLYALWRSAPGLIGVRRPSQLRASNKPDDGRPESGRLMERDRGPAMGEHGR